MENVTDHNTGLISLQGGQYSIMAVFKKLEASPAKIYGFSLEELLKVEQVAKAAMALKLDLPAYNKAKTLYLAVGKRLAGKPEQGKRNDLLTSSNQDEVKRAVKAHRRFRGIPELGRLFRICRQQTAKDEPLTFKYVEAVGKHPERGHSQRLIEPPGNIEKDITPSKKTKGQKAVEAIKKEVEAVEEQRGLILDPFSERLCVNIERLKTLLPELKSRGYSPTVVEATINQLRTILKDWQAGEKKKAKEYKTVKRGKKGGQYELVAMPMLQSSNGAAVANTAGDNFPF